MNKAYKLVLYAPPYTPAASGQMKHALKGATTNNIRIFMLLLGSVLAMHAYAAPAVNALPTGESIVSGSASFNRSISNRLIVNQTSDQLISNWNSFDIGSNARVSFVQPDSNSVALNRITSSSPTEILGSLNANGQLFIVNPNGIVFGTGSEVRAASVVASAFGINDKDFNAGNYLFKRDNNSTGQIINLGYIKASNGVVALLASNIINGGSIVAAGGDIALLNAEQIRITGASATVTQAASVQGSIQSSGRLQAIKVASAGGRVVLQAGQADSESSISLSGDIKAVDSLSASASRIDIGKLNSNQDSSLTATTTTVHDVFNLTGDTSQLDIRGAYTLSGSAAKINLRGAVPAFRVNGVDYVVIDNIAQLQAINHDAAALAGHYVLGSNINAAATASWNSGAGFQPIGSSSAAFNGVLDGLGHTVNALRIRRPAESVALIGTAQDAAISNINLRNVSLSGRAAAGLVFSSTDSVVDNSSAMGNIYIRQPDGDSQFISAGLVAINDGTVSNSHAAVRFSSKIASLDQSNVFTGGLVGLNKGSIQHSDATGVVSGFFNVGGLVGINSGFISDSNATASVEGSSAYIGGLVGSNSGSISNSYATGNVGNQGNNMDSGGLVGRNDGSVSNSHATGDVSGYLHIGGLIGYSYTDAALGSSNVVSKSYATGQVRGTYHTGGLIGEGNAVNISNSYASGIVQGSQYAGGLVGWLHDASVSNSYARGSVTGGYAVGGLFGRAENNTLNNSYWDKNSTGQAEAIGLVPIGMNNPTVNNLQGFSSSQMKQLSSYTGWDISTDPQGSSVWYIHEGSAPPLLR